MSTKKEVASRTATSITMTSSSSRSNRYEFATPKKQVYHFRKDNDNDEVEEETDFWRDLQDDVDEQETTTNLQALTARTALHMWHALVAFYIGESAEIPSSTNVTFVNQVERQEQLVRRSTFQLAGFSLFFWCWAVHNTRHMEVGQDLGMYSFGTVVLSSHYLLWVLSRSSTIPCLTRALVTASHVMVCLNYMLGILFAFTVGTTIYYSFATYCIVFTGLWAYIVYRGYTMLATLQRLNEEARLTQEQDMLLEGSADYF
jgi:hypothetical protein